MDGGPYAGAAHRLPDLDAPPGLGPASGSRFTAVGRERCPRRPRPRDAWPCLADGAVRSRGRQMEYHLARIDWRRAADALVRRGAWPANRSWLHPPCGQAIRTVTLAIGVRSDAAGEDCGRYAGGRPPPQGGLELLDPREPGPEVNWMYAETAGQADDLRPWRALGLVSLGETEMWRDPLPRLDFVPTMRPGSPPIRPRPGKVRRLPRRQRAEPPQAYLLHGVTGSGKTEIYLRAVEEVLASRPVGDRAGTRDRDDASDRARFLARFPGRVGLQHSGLSDGERYDTWRRCRDGQLRLVVGPRSALFAPLPDIGLIVLDEEHDESFKEQGQAPRYHARDVALAYAAHSGAVCILGSATPDIETTLPGRARSVGPSTTTPKDPRASRSICGSWRRACPARASTRPRSRRITPICRRCAWSTCGRSSRRAIRQSSAALWAGPGRDAFRR